MLVTLVVSRPAQAQREAAWELRVAERIELAVGEAAPLTISLAVDRRLAVSRDAAVIVDVDPDAGVAVKKRRLGRHDAVDPEADAPRFAVGLRGDAPGEHRVRLRVRFGLCGTRSCWPVDVRRVATAVVRPAAPGRDAGVEPAPPPPVDRRRRAR